MALVSTIIAGIGLGIAAIGAVNQYDAAKDAAKASEKAEKLRKRQMNLDAARRRRQVIREMLIARATSRANAAGQGVQGGDSAVIGGMQQATASAGMNTLAINQSQSIGQGIFSANADYAAAQGRQATGEAISGFGMSVAKNSATIARVGAAEGLWESDVG